MPTVTREIRIDAPPDGVRRHLDDPDRRADWYGGPALVPAPGIEDGSRFTIDGDDGRSVRIEVLPDGDGSRVRVTETSEVPAAPEAQVRTLRATAGPPVLLAAAA